MWLSSSSSCLIKSIRGGTPGFAGSYRPTQHPPASAKKKAVLLHPPQITTPSSPGNDRATESTGPSSRFCCLPSQKLHSTPALCTDLPGWQFELRVSTAQLRSSIPGSSNKLLMTLGKSPCCAASLQALPLINQGGTVRPGSTPGCCVVWGGLEEEMGPWPAAQSYRKTHLWMTRKPSGATDQRVTGHSSRT